LLQASHHETKLTAVGLGADAKTFQGTQGYAQLWLRLATGYGAGSATDSFKPVILLNYWLRDSSGHGLMARNVDKSYPDSKQTFFTYAGLLDGYQQAHDELKARLPELSKSVYSEIFEFSQPAAHASK
jgi:hypothetical protein